jgi:hypothetical protein
MSAHANIGEMDCQDGSAFVFASGTVPPGVTMTIGANTVEFGGKPTASVTYVVTYTATAEGTQ